MPVPRQTQAARTPRRHQIVTRTFAPPAGSRLESIEGGLSALVAAAGREGATSPAVIAYEAAIRRKGEEAAAAGGCEAMGYLLRRVADAVPEHAARREALIAAAWAGLPAWGR